MGVWALHGAFLWPENPLLETLQLRKCFTILFVCHTKAFIWAPVFQGLGRGLWEAGCLAPQMPQEASLFHCSVTGKGWELWVQFYTSFQVKVKFCSPEEILHEKGIETAVSNSCTLHLVYHDISSGKIFGKGEFVLAQLKRQKLLCLQDFCNLYKTVCSGTRGCMVHNCSQACSIVFQSLRQQSACPLLEESVRTILGRKPNSWAPLPWGDGVWCIPVPSATSKTAISKHSPFFYQVLFPPPPHSASAEGQNAIYQLLCF